MSYGCSTIAFAHGILDQKKKIVVHLLYLNVLFKVMCLTQTSVHDSNGIDIRSNVSLSVGKSGIFQVIGAIHFFLQFYGDFYGDE